MIELQQRSRHWYLTHGWSDADIDYAIDAMDECEQEDTYAMFIKEYEPGVMWLFPVGSTETFSLSLWKRIKFYIENFPNVVIPMDKNQLLVQKRATRYNGYLQDNMYLFGDDIAPVGTDNLTLSRKGLQWHE